MERPSARLSIRVSPGRHDASRLFSAARSTTSTHRGILFEESQRPLSGNGRGPQGTLRSGHASNPELVERKMHARIASSYRRNVISMGTRMAMDLPSGSVAGLNVPDCTVCIAFTVKPSPKPFLTQISLAPPSKPITASSNTVPSSFSSNARRV